MSVQSEIEEANELLEEENIKPEFCEDQQWIIESDGEVEEVARVERVDDDFVVIRFVDWEKTLPIPKDHILEAYEKRHWR